MKKDQILFIILVVVLFGMISVGLVKDAEIKEKSKVQKQQKTSAQAEV